MAIQEHTKLLANRLTKIEGQIRGIKVMIEQDRECEEIIMQLSAVSSAIKSVARVIMENHIEHHVVEGIREGDEENTLRSLKTVIEQFSKLK